MPGSTALFLASALAAILLPAAFLVVVVYAVRQRRRDGLLALELGSALAATAGLALGSLFAVGADDPLTALPFVAVLVVLAGNEVRSGRRATAGCLVAGFALPWTLLWAASLVLVLRGAPSSLGPLATALRFAAGALPTAIGLLVAGSAGTAGTAGTAWTAGSANVGEATPAAESVAAPDTAADTAAPAADRDQTAAAVWPSRATGRSFLVVAHAMRAASWLGPIPLPELAAVAAWALVDLAGGLLTAGQPPLLRVALIAIVGSAVASEAYLRAMAPATRRSMEAFSWLGDADLRAIREATGRGVPTTALGAHRWLASHAPDPNEPPVVGGLRVQLLLLAGRSDDAARVAAGLPAPDAAAEHARLSLQELVGWWRGEPSRVPAMRAAEARVEPVDGEARIAAEVGTAIAEVRRRAVGDDSDASSSDPADQGSVLDSLLRARDRVGVRADGLLRRTLWRPIFGVFLAASLLFGLVGLVSGAIGGA